MDACTYESITGLKNYYGFKSLLKNGSLTSKYGCDDETIIFNRIQSFSFTTGTFNLATNQVAVLLNLSNDYYPLSAVSYIPNAVIVTDVNSSLVVLNPNSLIFGFVFVQSITPLFSVSRQSGIIAIFDLF